MLDSWNDGEAKSRIVEFVRNVTTPGDGFVPPAERIATFDNDGTLWCEKPNYVQAEFLMRRSTLAADAEAGAADPDVPRTEAGEPSRSGRRKRMADFLDRVPDLVSGVADAVKGMTTEAFEELVREFFDTATHPTLGVPYTHVAYRPMIELLELLQANDFHVYICTAGGRDFVRVVSEEVYGIPRDHVIGSAGTLEYRDGDIYRKKGIELPIDEGPGKPVHIWKRTGRKPLFACGNADGDTEMLEIAKFPLLIRHDDAEREFAYDMKAEKVQAEANDRGWTVVSMKEDFREVF
jgi:phosphoserine phosphatase